MTSQEYHNPCQKKCLQHKFHCVICNTACSFSPANYASRLEDIPNACNFCSQPQTTNLPTVTDSLGNTFCIVQNDTITAINTSMGMDIISFHFSAPLEPNDTIQIRIIKPEPTQPTTIPMCIDGPLSPEKQAQVKREFEAAHPTTDEWDEFEKQIDLILGLAPLGTLKGDRSQQIKDLVYSNFFPRSTVREVLDGMEVKPKEGECFEVICEQVSRNSTITEIKNKLGL